MANPFVCSARVGGSCAYWFPRVRDELIARGVVDPIGDLSSLCLSGYSDRFFFSATLAPAGSDTDIVISVTSNADFVDKNVDKEVSLC